MVPVLRLRPVLRGLLLGVALAGLAGCSIFGGKDDETNDANKDAANYRERTVDCTQCFSHGSISRIAPQLPSRHRPIRPGLLETPTEQHSLRPGAPAAPNGRRRR